MQKTKLTEATSKHFTTDKHEGEGQQPSNFGQPMLDNLVPKTPEEVLREQQHALAFAEKRIAALSHEITQIYASTSWRATRPLRAISYRLKQGKRVASRSSQLLRMYGIVGIARKVGSVIKHEGLSGLKQRLALQGITDSRNDYTEWIRRYDTIDDSVRTRIRDRISGMPQPPVISLVMPTYNANPQWLTETIESVQKQLYPHWELCIADDASTNAAIRPLLERFMREDSRIKVVFREQNGHISAASNSALKLATGEWIALLDHDDLLAEHALYCVADAILSNPEIRLIYSDEDKIDVLNNRHGHYFKPDWNPDLFYSHNVFSHLGVYHRPLLEKIGGFRQGLEGSQDYDLALRCIEQISNTAIHHIPRVLYHWRVHAESTASGAAAKPYAMLAGERALNEHFARTGVKGKVEFIGNGYRACYDLPATLPLVSLIIPTRNGLQLIRQCIDSIIKKTTYSNYEIIVVDNGSDDQDTLAYFESLQRVSGIRILRDERPFNYSALNNAAVSQARGEIIGLINNDIEVITPDWLSEMVSHVLRAEVGAVGAKLLYPNNTIQHAGVIMGVGGIANHSHKHFEKSCPGYLSRAVLISSFSAVTAACLLVKKSIYEQVNGLNEQDLQVAFNDVDFCLRLREAGYRNIWTPYTVLYHHESATRGQEDNPEKKARFARESEYMQKRWGALLMNDPAYSPNLTRDYEDFSLAWPPRVAPLA